MGCNSSKSDTSKVAPTSAKVEVKGDAKTGFTRDVDVCIIGAGASGMYAAHKLLSLGKTVCLIEKQDHVGGHSETWHPGPGKSFIDMGVRIYPTNKFITDLWTEYGVAYSKADLTQVKRQYLDYDTGNLSPWKQPDILETIIGLGAYDWLYKCKFPYLQNSGIQLPDNIPEELLMPFGEYLKKYNIDKGYSSMINYLEGFGQVADVPTLFCLKNLRPAIIEAVLTNTFLKPNEGAEQLYLNMQKKWGEGNILLGATVASVTRAADKSIVTVANTKDGQQTVRSKHIMISIPPTKKNFSVIDLDAQEHEVFDRFIYNQYFTMALTITGLPSEILFNGGTAGPLSAMGKKGIYSVMPTTVPGIYNAFWGTEWGNDMTEEEVKAATVKAIEGINPALFGTQPNVVEWNLVIDHSPYFFHVSADDIKNGFYKRLWNLQGHRGTYFLGAAVDTHDTMSVMMHADLMVDKMYPAGNGSAAAAPAGK